MPGKIEKLDVEIARLHGVMADPELYARDPAGFAKAGADLSKAEAERAAAEDEWLRLELLREEMEQSA